MTWLGWLQSDGNLTGQTGTRDWDLIGLEWTEPGWDLTWLGAGK
jgi:hypothetical protein